MATAARSIETLGFPVATIMHDVRGGLDAPMTLGGSYRYPEIETKVAGDAVVLPLIGEVRAAASVVASTAPRISRPSLRRGTAAITGDVRADITNRVWTGNLHVEAPNARNCRNRFRRHGVTGPLSADAILGGTFDAFQLDTDQRPRADVGGAGDRSRHGESDRHRDAIDVSSLQLFQGAGYLDGRLRYGETGARGELKGDRLSWQDRCCAQRYAGDSQSSSTAPAPRRTQRARRASISL